MVKDINKVVKDLETEILQALKAWKDCMKQEDFRKAVSGRGGYSEFNIIHNKLQEAIALLENLKKLLKEAR